MTNILKEEASFNKYQSSQKTSALRRSHPVNRARVILVLFQKLLFAADEAICFHGLLREFCSWGIFLLDLTDTL
jgi:hypothetical protein